MKGAALASLLAMFLTAGALDAQAPTPAQEIAQLKERLGVVTRELETTKIELDAVNYGRSSMEKTLSATLAACRRESADAKKELATARAAAPPAPKEAPAKDAKKK